MADRFFDCPARRVIAASHPDRDLAKEIEGCDNAIEPESAPALVDAIKRLAKDLELHARLSANARKRAE